MAQPTPTPMPQTHRTRTQEVSLGMVLLGITFSSILYGIMLTQTHKYFQRFRKDPPVVKALVLAVLILNTISMFFVGHASWYYLVTNGVHAVAIWSLNVELALSMIMSAISELFLTYRVYQFSGRNYWLTIILFSLAVLHFGSGEVAAIKFLLLKDFARFASVKVPSILRLGSAAVCDTAIALSLSFFLNKKRTGFKRNDEIINYLILFSINSGLMTSMISIASLITYIVVPRLWVYTALCFLISRLYANTFLCSLNSRQILVNDEDKSPINAIPRKYRKRSKISLLNKSDPEKTPTQLDVYVVTETITDGPTMMDTAKIRNSNTHLKQILEDSSDSSFPSSSSSSSSSRTSLH
ncbi:hypothetical protein BJ165DRAFT_276507 [Panaeolus papilionaceus]|nr:hypothetical protein BJ165DRAFT_276507 [Panaeolus papilionaceus]